jgi:mannose-6-phosphate isomerase
VTSSSSFLLPLRGAIRNYAWGSRSFLAGLRGAAVPSTEPEAELWMGAHPAAPAQVRIGEHWLSLHEVIARDPACFLGAASVERFGLEAPFLLKILAIERPLSLQVHPDRTQARAGFQRERSAGLPLEAGSYRDPRHKPELIVALEPLTLLSGLLEPSEIRRRFAEAGISSLAAETDRLERGGPAAFRDFLAAWLGAKGAARARMIAEARRVAKSAERSVLGPDTPGHWVARLFELHPDDPAVLAPLALPLLRLAPGEGSFQPPRILHSYLDGAGVEVMANSDNVVRAGLTAKPVDTGELLEVVDVTPIAPSPIRATTMAGGAARYESAAEDFELWRLESRGGEPATMKDGATLVVGVCTSGGGRLRAPRRGESLDLESGGAFVARAGAGELEAAGDITLFAASLARPERDR